MMTPQTPTGFTLVETLVSVLLLTMTIVLPYYAIQRSLTATYTARDDLIASALAQEALEFVRSTRDNNFLAGRPSSDWLYGLDGGSGEFNCITPNRCTVDPTRDTFNQSVIQCASNNCSYLPVYLSATGLYTHVVTGVRTRYTRDIQITVISANEVRVTATVKWFYRGAHSIVITDVLTNWL